MKRLKTLVQQDVRLAASAQPKLQVVTLMTGESNNASIPGRRCGHNMSAGRIAEPVLSLPELVGMVVTQLHYVDAFTHIKAVVQNHVHGIFNQFLTWLS